jgi:hypothetical protein
MLYLATPGAGRQNGKTYYVRDEQERCAAYVGSANLTRGGLETNLEAGIALDDAVDGTAAVETILRGIMAWCDHPASVLVTPDVATAFADKPRAAHIGRARPSGSADPTWRLADMLPDALGWIEAAGSREQPILGVPTGFDDLDALTNGLHPGSLVVVGSRPSIGKTTLLLDFCRAATLRHNLPSALFSLEMPRQEINLRLFQPRPVFRCTPCAPAVVRTSLQGGHWHDTARLAAQPAAQPRGGTAGDHRHAHRTDRGPGRLPQRVRVPRAVHCASRRRATGLPQDLQPDSISAMPTPNTSASIVFLTIVYNLG